MYFSRLFLYKGQICHSSPDFKSFLYLRIHLSSTQKYIYISESTSLLHRNIFIYQNSPDFYTEVYLYIRIHLTSTQNNIYIYQNPPHFYTEIYFYISESTSLLHRPIFIYIRIYFTFITFIG